MFVDTKIFLLKNPLHLSRGVHFFSKPYHPLRGRSKHLLQPADDVPRGHHQQAGRQWGPPPFMSE